MREPAQEASFSIEPTRSIAASRALIETGGEIFLRQCAPCHGDQGKGDGPAHHLLYPKPRDLTAGVFRFTSTWEGTPTDADLYRVVSRGIPGSAMPSWPSLAEEDRWALVHFVKTLSSEPLEIAPTKPANVETLETGEGIVDVPPEPADDADSRKRGSEIFATTCSACHGPTGRGDGKNAADLRDSAGFPIRPRDLASGVFKGSPRPDLLYRRVVAGIPGTPMPATPALAGADGWHVVHYVLALSSPTLRELAEMKRYRIVAARVEKVPEHPDAGAWNDVPAVNLHLMPLWWRYERPEYLTVKALHDDKELGLLLFWTDGTDDHIAIRPQDFRDAAAIQFALAQDPPFFAMGEANRFVNIWMWKSERQAELTMLRDIDVQYPNVGIDSYPNIARAPYEQPHRYALTLDSDPTFVTAWGAGNIVADVTRKDAAEDLRARGFGTLVPRDRQDVRSFGVHSTGSYRVVFRRSMTGAGDQAVDLSPGRTVPLAFAVWNGSAGDRDGKKSVTIWQDLTIEP